MTLHDDIRNKARIDSRRFGKSIVCRIVYADLLAAVKAKGLLPPSISSFISERTGLDPVNNKMVVIPVTKYEEAKRLLKEQSRAVSNTTDLDDIVSTRTYDDAFINFMRQNIILVNIHQGAVPEGVKAGVNPAVWDVLIDSVDVNQSIEAYYVYRSAADIREANLRWSDQ